MFRILSTCFILHRTCTIISVLFLILWELVHITDMQSFHVLMYVQSDLSFVWCTLLEFVYVFHFHRTCAQMKIFVKSRLFSSLWYIVQSTAMQFLMYANLKECCMFLSGDYPTTNILPKTTFWVVLQPSGFHGVFYAPLLFPVWFVMYIFG